MFHSPAYPVPVPSSYCLGTYPAPCGQQLLFVPPLLSSWSLLSSGMLIHRRYCPALSEVQIESVYCSRL